MLNKVHSVILTKIREATAEKGGLLAEKFQSMEDEQITRLMFSNYRGKELSHGMRLTKFGLQVMLEFFKGINITLTGDQKIKMVHMLYLEKSSKFPYYFEKNELILFDDMLGFKLKLADGNIDVLMKIEKTEIQN